MQRQQDSFDSGILQRKVEYLWFGSSGRPLVMFPTSGGRYTENEDRELVATLGDYVTEGRLQVCCIDTFNDETWGNTSAAVGLLLLIGIVVNNGIVMIEHINSYRRAGVDRMKAMLNVEGDVWSVTLDDSFGDGERVYIRVRATDSSSNSNSGATRYPKNPHEVVTENEPLVLSVLPEVTCVLGMPGESILWSLTVTWNGGPVAGARSPPGGDR